MPGLPSLTHLQFLILGILLTGEKAGKEIRALLKKQRVSRTGPAFYQLMARMEDAKLVKGWYDQKIIDGQIIKERRYQALGHGVKAYNATREFYLTQGSGFVMEGGLVGA